LYNPSYEPISDAEIELMVKNQDGKEYPYIFKNAGDAYRLDIGTLPAGNYTYTAVVSQGAEQLADGGSFGVKPFQLEGNQLIADHQTLAVISNNSGARTIYPEELRELIDELKTGSNQLKPVSYSNEILSSILNFKWIFFLLLLLVSVEWFFRKYLGRY
jgi:hypothetical protein